MGVSESRISRISIAARSFSPCRIRQAASRPVAIECRGKLRWARSAQATASPTLPAQELEAKPHRFLRCHRTLRRRALDVLEHEITRANVVDLANVRMVQACDRACFSLESALPVGFRRQPRGQDLESDDAIEASVACTIDLAHPAGAKRRENFLRNSRRLLTVSSGCTSYRMILRPKVTYRCRSVSESVMPFGNVPGKS